MEETRRVISTSKNRNENKGESSNNHKVYCYYCQKEGHYKNQCPVKTNEKQPAVNMVIAEVTNVQQVTTWSKGKVAGWETQEAIRKQATEWIKKANEHNVAEVEDQNVQQEEAVKHTEDNPTCQALQECQIMLPLAHLLQLVPRFTADLQAVGKQVPPDGS